MTASPDKQKLFIFLSSPHFFHDNSLFCFFKCEAQSADDIMVWCLDIAQLRCGSTFFNLLNVVWSCDSVESDIKKP